MTRPMPGPPGGFTDRARLNYALLGKQITYEQYQEFGDALTRAFTARPKRMTDAECAAEYWRATSVLALALYAPAEVLGVATPSDGHMHSWERPDSEPLNREHDTWDRFATHPHALEES